MSNENIEAIEDTDDSNVVIDCDVLEASKENIQPLASGRRVTTLASVLATPHGQRDARLAATRARLRAQVDAALASEDEEADDNDEPDEALPAYVHLVNWTVEHYPQGHSAESGILELLEEATRVLKERKGCKGDARYLRLWVMYARYVDRPEVIYEYLLANDIGTAWAALYEEYAMVLERDGRRTRADEIFLLGIARRAEPFDHLQNRHRDFQMRMMTTAGVPSTDSDPAPPAQTPASTTTASPRRTVLGSVPIPAAPTSSSSTRRSGTTGRTGTGPARSDTSDIFSAPAPPTRASSSSSSQNGRRLEIFDDAAEEGPERAAGNAWPSLEPRKTRIKENVRDVEKMGGAVMKPKGSDAKRATEAKKRNASAAKGKLVVFSDEDEVEEPAGRSVATAALKTPAASSKKKASSFAILEDTESESPVVPATPKFELFTDEDNTPMSGSSSSGSLAPGSVMRAKAVQPGLASSEAEALRRDPFKNYTKDN
ncbi:hypothetical protein SCHPADRAFT_873660 [Schizopora paradoxa]|uniref:BUB1 N-terminal domain-containing protein n=1 Tax=Schizopora paradoxa TaxID=27342 RepID=A0A0H2RNZ9_9AGAM|nr:hypothetical protein SCHPADRAFT_873660 [Schizopora paradoxa]